MLGIQYWIVDHMAQSKHRAKVAPPSLLPLIWGCYASVGPLPWILTTCSMPFGTILGSISFLIFANSWGILDRWHELKSDTHCLIKLEEVFLSTCLCLLKLCTVYLLRGRNKWQKMAIDCSHLYSWARIHIFLLKNGLAFVWGYFLKSSFKGGIIIVMYSQS